MVMILMLAFIFMVLVRMLIIMLIKIFVCVTIMFVSDFLVIKYFARILQLFSNSCL